MTTAIAEMTAVDAGPDNINEFGIYQPTDFAEKLRNDTVGCRVTMTKFFARKALQREQVKTAADQFHADAKMVSAAKRLLDTSTGPYQKVTAILSRARKLWLSLTIDYPIQGIRLMRKSLVTTFHQEMETIKGELDAATGELEDAYQSMKDEARTRLGDLFNEMDYPAELGVQFSLEWDFPNVEPTEELKKLNPALYEAERTRIAARFEEAVAMAEAAFVEELHSLVANIADKLTAAGEADGKKKVLKAAAVGNLHDFFAKFRTMAIHSNSELDRLVKEAEEVVKGLEPSQIRSDETVRDRVRESMNSIANTLGDMMENKHVRSISFDDSDE